MKRLILFVSLFLLLSWSTVFALNFTPLVMKLSAPSHVQYDFDGKDVMIPLQVSGKPATVIFTVYTSNKAALINQVRNGYIGWHYVNKIDTCVYVAPPQFCDVGSNVIQWNGLSNARWDFYGFTDGDPAPADDYTYYIWGYDSASPKQHVTKSVPYGWVERGFIQTNGTDGKPLSNPVIYHANYEDGGSKELKPHTNYKWVIGNDPMDDTRIETCITKDYAYGNTFAFHPKDTQIFFNHTFNNEGLAIIRKWKWIPNGEAEQLYDWGDNGYFRYDVTNAQAFNFFAGVVSDGGEYLFTTDGDISGNSTHSDLIALNVNTGTLDRRLDLSSFWTVDNSDMTGGYSTEGPNEICMVNGKMLLGTMWSWEIGMIDPYAESSEIDPHLWFNANGDGVCDMIKSDNPWGLPGRAYEQKWRTQMDANLFATTTAYDLGAVTFSLLGPDGTGIGYFALAGETASQKFGQTYVQNNSAYDGMYVDDASNKEAQPGWFWIGHDSISGTISTVVFAKDASPAAFTVSQNTPNPFNPSTTINFTLAREGKVTVDVFNIAGQKVYTIANGAMSQGSHTVTWNAARFSAGVYFYTVTYGSHTKTMKMTLLK